MFLDLYKDFKVAGEALKEYTAKLPQRTDELGWGEIIDERHC